MSVRDLEVKTLFNTSNCTAAGTATYVDLANSASVGKRDMKCILISTNASTLATFGITLWECDTTAGTYTAVNGDSLAAGAITTATNGITEVHVQPQKRYIRAEVDAMHQTSALVLLLVNMKRQY